MPGKLIGKVLGEVVVSPLTVAAEIVEAAKAAIDQTGDAITRAVDKIEGEEES